MFVLLGSLFDQAWLYSTGSIGHATVGYIFEHGLSFGRDIPAWQEYVAGLPGAGDLSEAGTTQVAEQPTGQFLTR